MDILKAQIERIIVGANIALDEGNVPAPDTIAAELEQLYAANPDRAAEVRIRVTGDGTIEIVRAAGRARHLRVAKDGALWELSDGAIVETPGHIATILANL